MARPMQAHIRRPPSRAALRPFFETVWAASEEGREGGRELVLPTAQAHLVVRLSENPLLVHAESGKGRVGTLAHTVLGGPRWAARVRDVSQPVQSVGAQLLPGALQALFGIDADELAGRHTSLDDLWHGERFRERLLEIESLPLQLDLFERLLAERISGDRAMHPVVAHALSRFQTVSDVSTVVRETGYSHRQFASLFRRAVGMPPKRYCRVRRFKKTLDHLAAHPTVAWAELALARGFSDQPHMVREFRAMSGLTPGRYRALAPLLSRHVPLP